MSSIKPPWSLVIPDELSYEVWHSSGRSRVRKGIIAYLYMRIGSPRQSFNRNIVILLARFAYPTLEFKGPEETRPCLGKASLMLVIISALLIVMID
ncbi:unnamed protein product [Sphenostylis stenocarpa]|uniref:Uncharacterized protein n=1 Tax=Sphenostylis stenocarpa TaxID=92480 RepID=A0AA86TAD5_9FABA|nr:unnamed protein product [Sphenostylis stenocarpa]